MNMVIVPENEQRVRSLEKKPRNLKALFFEILSIWKKMINIYIFNSFC